MSRKVRSTEATRGLYVQAWLWVDLEPGKWYEKIDVITMARRLYASDGEVEIDSNARLSYNPDTEGE